MSSPAAGPSTCPASRDLVVIYLGMQVNPLDRAPRRCSVQPSNVQSRPGRMGCSHENLVWSLFPPHVGMRQYWTLTHSSVGHNLIPTGGGGNTFSAIPAARDFGTKPIACAAGWRRCTTTSRRRSGSCGLFDTGGQRRAVYRQKSGGTSR